MIIDETTTDHFTSITINENEWYDLERKSLEKTSGHDARVALIPNKCEDHSKLSIKQTPVRNGVKSKDPIDWYDYGWLSIKQTVDHNAGVTKQPNEWDDHRIQSMKQTTDFDGCNSIQPNDWYDHWWISVKQTIDHERKPNQIHKWMIWARMIIDETNVFIQKTR